MQAIPEDDIARQVVVFVKNDDRWVVNVVTKSAAAAKAEKAAAKKGKK